MLTASVAAAAPLPTRPTPGSLKGGAPPPAEGEQTGTAPLRSLSVGASGSQVMALQRQLKRRGYRVTVDGDFGAGTRTAVRKLQKRMRMRATGIATTSFLRRLGIKSAPAGASPAPRVTGNGRYLKAFPMGGKNYSYSNDFGAARAQGGHQGNDIIAPRGAPILSATHGKIQRLTRVETGLGGLWIWIVDPQGNEYYYAHLDTVAAGLQEGTEVWPGRVIGTNGNTGDARYGVHHLHFEIRLRGGSIINPYTHLLGVDPKRNGASNARGR